MLATIPHPPMPPTATLAIMATAAILIGAILLLKGRKHGAWVLCAVFVASAIAAAPYLTTVLPVKNVYIVGAISAVAAATLGYFLARLWWAAILGLMLSITALAVAVHYYPGGFNAAPTWAKTNGQWHDWLLAAVTYFWGYLDVFGKNNLLFFGLVGGIAALIGLTVGLIYPRIMAVLVTSLVGAASLTLGIGLAAWAISPAWLEARRWSLGLFAAGALALVGIGLQGYGLHKQAKKPKDEAKPASPAKKK